MVTPQKSGTNERNFMVAAPRDYFLGPIFAATKHSQPREVTIGNRRYLIGGFHPMRRNFSPPALDVRHARAIFALLSFREPFASARIVRFSFNDFCRRYASSNGGRYSRAIVEILADLLDSYIRVTDTESGIGHEYRLIEHIDIEKRPIRRKDDSRASSGQLEMWINGATLSEEFFSLLSRIAELQHVKLDVFTSIRSPLAQAIYLYIPSRAHHHSESSPFEISISTLLQQVSHPVPATPQLRRKLVTQNRNSILSQLDGMETLSGVFRVKLAQTADGADWKLQAWVDRNAAPKPLRPIQDSKMARAFLAAGRTREELKKRLGSISALSSYELDLMEKAQVKLEGSMRAFELAKALLGETRFDRLLAEAKGDALEKRHVSKTPNHRLMSRVMEALRTK